VGDGRIAHMSKADALAAVGLSEQDAQD
jgi:hypothetical protein